VSAGLLLGAVPAWADQAAADRCAVSLSPQATMIYRATAPDIHPDTVIADAIKTRVRPMAMNGQISRSDAQTAAPSAGACLKLLHP
jgi:DNA-binding transcriptional regulator YdaS (Cro superfamily)